MENKDIKICQNCFEEPALPNSSLCKYCDDVNIDWDDDNLEELIEGIDVIRSREEYKTIKDDRRLRIRIRDDITLKTLAILNIHIDEHGNLAIEEDDNEVGYWIDNVDTHVDEKGCYEFAGVTLSLMNRLTLKDIK